MIEERYELSIERIRDMKEEETKDPLFKDYFHKMAEFVMMIDEVRTELEDGSFLDRDMEALAKENRRLYEDILGTAYETSYANPAFAVRVLGEEYGRILSFLYTELRGCIAYVFEQKTEYLDILFELLIAVYNQFEEEANPLADRLKDCIYWFVSDYCDVFVADRIREQIDPAESFAADLVMNSSTDDLKYLYRFGEYISENELKTARHPRSSV